ncbi:hypothetical protein [Meiothermus sp. CFH 77666]|uniref:Vgb family protein n=1 Tax=Meiothermus sp. CFH 77666 TaxID=2817942 RepID=UPI001FB17437|nr:hypothetical protein [Meiothermus sp. CFH 77666]
MKQVWFGLLGALSLLLTACPGGQQTACNTDGQGTLQVIINGLPPGINGKVTVSGPNSFSQTLTSSQTLSVGGGNYVIDVKKTTSQTTSSTVVRSAYTGSSDKTQACVKNNETSQITVTYNQIPSSAKLWTINNPPKNSGDARTLGYAGNNLETSNTAAAAVSADTALARDLTFDPDGNLWMLGGTTSDPTLLRYPASTLGATGSKTPDKRLDVSGFSCVPGAERMAFDPNGHLWLSIPCAKKLVRVTSNQLNGATSSLTTVAPTVEISGFSGTPRGLAFDASGNLWVGHDLSSNSGQVMRFDASSLNSSTTASSAVRILTANLAAGPTNTAYDLAFDNAGSLWVLCFNCGGAILYKYTSTQLTGTGSATLSPDKQISLPATALPRAFAFDEGGGLWLAYDKPSANGRFARLSPSQLTVDSSPGSPTIPERIIEGSTLGNANSIVLYPAPANLPLFHRLPN